MCIVIDTNTLSRVFESTDIEHDEFKPVLDWIRHGKGQIVYGGTKYIHEIKSKYLRLFVLYRDQRKAISISSLQVDAEEGLVAAKIQHQDFDDQHLVSLLRVSGCRLICSKDKRAFPFFTHKSFFNPAFKRPKIYSGKRNRQLLNDLNIADICKPCHPTTKEQKMALRISFKT